MKTILLPALILSGTIIGAGMFGLPYAFSQTGFFTGSFYLIVLAFVLLVVHLAYADIITNVSGDHRLVGYTKYIIGGKGFIVASVIKILSLLGGLVVYIALGIQFSRSLFGGILFPALGIWILFSVAIIFGVRIFRRLEQLLVLAMIVLVTAIFFFGVPTLQLPPESPSVPSIMLLYGIGIFAFYGASAIPEIKDHLTSKKRIIGIMLLGTLAPAIMYLIFIAGIWGLSGSGISEDALSGITSLRGLKTVGFVIGILSVTTSYWTISLNLKNVLHLDYGMHKNSSRILVLFVPIGIYLITQKSFLALMGIVGAVAGGLEGILVLTLYMALRGRRKKYVVRIPTALSILLVLLFAGGIAHALISFFS